MGIKVTLRRGTRLGEGVSGTPVLLCFGFLIKKLKFKNF